MILLCVTTHTHWEDISSQGQGQGFFICHIIVIQGITRSEMQSNQVRSVDSAKQ